MSTHREGTRFFIGVAWSAFKVVAVMSIIGVGLVAVAYFSPLELSGPKIATAGILLGLIGTAWARSSWLPFFAALGGRHESDGSHRLAPGAADEDGRGDRCHPPAGR